MNLRWCFFLTHICLSAFALNLTDPLFDRLDYDELLARENELNSAPAGSDRDFQLLQVQLFLAESASLRTMPHVVNQWLELAEIPCRQFEAQEFSQFSLAERALPAYTCALLNATRLADSSFFSQVSRAKSIDADIAIAKSASPDPLEKLYAEGRIFLSLPPAWGRNFGKAFMAFLSLQRLKPELKSATFFLARAYQTQGNFERAEALYREALKQNDRRAKYFFSEFRGFIDEKIHNDGGFYGVFPGIFYNAARGFGGTVSLVDDRYLDTDRSLSARASLATRGVFELGISYRDQASSPTFGLDVSGSMYYGVEDFFGVGLSTSVDSPINVWRTYLAANVNFPLPANLLLRIGLRGRSFALNSAGSTAYAASGFFDANNSVDVGPAAEISYDTRDSNFNPERGEQFLARGYFALPSLGSFRSFQTLDADARVFNQLGEGFSLNVRILGTLQWGEVPFAAYVRNGRGFTIPGVREGRYEDQDMLGAVAEIKFPIISTIKGALFGTGLAFSEQANALWQSTWGWGGGAALEIAMSQYRRNLTRIEVGVFNSEWVVQGNGSINF